MSTVVAMNDLVMAMGKRIAQLRALVPDLTARKLDDYAGVARGYTSILENGGRKGPKGRLGGIGADVAVGYARALGTTTDFLLRGAGKPPGAAAVAAAVEGARLASEAATPKAASKKRRKAA